MKRNNILFTVIVLLLFVLNSCKEEKVVSSFLKAPFGNLNPKYVNFTFNAEEGNIFDYETGTRIEIPPNIWSDSAGNEVKGAIGIKYREFHDAYDIFLAGVPLSYDSAEMNNNLSTAGMFEIKAFKDSMEVFIKQGKSMKVSLTTYTEEPNYNFYSLNEKSENWEYKGYNAPIVNPKIKEIDDSITKLKPKFDYNFGKDYFALDYYAILDVYFNVKPRGNVNKYYKNKTPKRKAEKYGLTFSGIYGTWQQLKFEGKRHFACEIVWKNISGKTIPNWVNIKKYQTDNRLIKLTPLGNNQYNMTVVDRYYEAKKKFIFKVEAITTLNKVFKIKPAEWRKKYDKVMEEIEEQQKRKEKMASVVRVFDVNRTGFHNWDRVYNAEEKFYVNGNFKFDKDNDIEEKNIIVCYFIDNNKSFIMMDATEKEMILVPDSTAKLIAVLSDNKAAVFNSRDYNKINFQKLKNEKNYTFDMKSISVSSKDDLLKNLN